MIRSIFGAVALVLLSVGVSAAGVSTTEFSGTGFSNAVTIGGSTDVNIYSGFAASVETANDIESGRVDIYGGISADTGSFVETSATTSSFVGSAFNNGLVGRTDQYTVSDTVTVGAGVDTSLDIRTGVYGEVSIVGRNDNGAIGVETGAYVNTDYSTTITAYGSDTHAETYSVNSYALD